jgi:hypothetical protein
MEMKVGTAGSPEKLVNTYEASWCHSSIDHIKTFVIMCVQDLPAPENRNCVVHAHEYYKSEPVLLSVKLLSTKTTANILCLAYFRFNVSIVSEIYSVGGYWEICMDLIGW